MKKIYLVIALAILPYFLKAQKILDERLNEISGLAVSASNKGLLWVNNDSGDLGRVFLIDTLGKTLATYNWDAKPIDCEAISLGNNNEGKPAIFVGDIGDNDAKRTNITIYSFTEPILTDTAKKSYDLKKVIKLKLKYPDGSRDAECLMTDPIEKKLYIVSKRENEVGIYSTSINFTDGEERTLTKEGTITFKGFGKLKWITAGDISADGQQIIVKSYMSVFYWRREKGKSLMQVLKNEPKILPYKMEPQGEAIGFTADGKGYYTISEGKFSDIKYYKIDMPK